MQQTQKFSVTTYFKALIIVTFALPILVILVGLATGGDDSPIGAEIAWFMHYFGSFIAPVWIYSVPGAIAYGLWRYAGTPKR